MAVTDKKKKKNYFGLIKFAVVLCAAVYLCCTLISQQLQLSGLNKNISSIESGISQEKERNKQLLDKKKLIDTPEYIESIARNKLDLVAPDEIIFMEAPKK